ncbi:MAG: S8 family peptidase [Bacteroidales bacterium]|nr:S8 family peptidase [Bacteroidales bacterium]
MKTKLTLLYLFIFLPFFIFSQYQSKTILVKILPKYAVEFSNNQALSQILQESKGTIQQIFPKHKKPNEEYDRYGHQLVDLSLWHQLVYKSDIPETSIINKLQKIGIFKYVEQRPLNTLFYTPNDPKRGNQWYLDIIHAYDAWDVEMGDTNVVVGVTDTGIDRVHEDLIDGIKYNYQDPVDGIDNDNDGFLDNFCGWDVGNNDNNPQWGPIGHGTFVSGFVSAVPDNGVGIAGVGYNIKTLPVKIDDTEGKLTRDYEGIVYAADKFCAVINCAWGGPVFTQFGKDVVNYATFNRNVLVVAACGNSNSSVWMYPASYDIVLSVAATDSLDVRWAQSSYGSMVDMNAPGTFVYSTWPGNVYFSSHGTSFSSPMVAAAAALVKSHYPWMNALQLGEQMRVSADIIDTIAGNIPTKDFMGSGRLNMHKALIDTTSPALRFENQIISFSTNDYSDTISISGDFINYLSPSSSALKATISTTSPYLLILNSTFNIGQLPTNGIVNNNNNAFKIRILPSIPLGYQADIKVTYSDGNYSGFEFVRIELNKDFINIDTNKIALTLTSNSRLGYNDDYQNQGVGMVYKGGRSMLSYGGLLVATSGNQVSDNIYGQQGYDHDFKTIVPIKEILNPSQGDQAFFCEFNDDNASFSKLNIKVKQFSYAYNQAGKDQFVILEYHIFNLGNAPLTNLHTALFADFDIEKSSANKASHDPTHRLAYTYPTSGGKHAGLMILEGINTNIYNIDNDGKNGSVRIYDDFYGFEKFQTMTQARDSAGYGNGGDVSNMISAGPYTIAKNDSIVVSFAVLVGDHLHDLKQVAQEAYDTYYNTASISNQQEKEQSLYLYTGQPNPFSSKTKITIINDKKQNIQLSVYDNLGQLRKKWTENKLPKGTYHFILNAGELRLKSGVYHLVLSSSNEHYSRKLILIE